MAGYTSYDGSSSSAAPPPPYSVTASASGSGNFGSTSSSLFAPPPTTAHAAHGESHAGPSSGFPSGGYGPPTPDYLGIVDSKRRLADPRSSSAHSLAPSIKDRDGVTRRTLLIIYIHGFYGNESSFRSFPAHVHNYLKDALAETHVVHSKIYPRYKTYKAIDVARDNFSQWLEPHESDSTDVILIGHSMGGLLAAEVAMMPNRHPYRRHPYKHRILGTISLDSPFLGLHPGIIVAGISSLFRPASPAEEQLDQFDPSSNSLSPDHSSLTSPNPSMYTLETNSSLGAELSPHASNTPSLSSNGPPQRPDPTFNPPFFNDLNLKDRPFMRRLGHFAKKHSREGIWDATKNHVMSHLEYGGCLADYPGLNARYNKLRAMESVDPLQHMSAGNNYSNANQPPPVRVRFINYYTLSTGRPKKPKTPDSPKSPESLGSPEDRFVSGPPNTLEVGSRLSPPTSMTPRISVEDSDDGKSMELLEPIPMDDVDERLSTLHEEQQARFNHESMEASKSTEALRRGLSQEASESKGKEKERLDNTINSYESPTTEQSNVAAVGGGEGEAHKLDPTGDGIDEPELPPIPDLPEQPTPPDLDKYTDKDARKQAEKEGKRAQKAYEHAVKSRDKAIKERQKLVEKRRKKAEKEAQKEAQRIEKEEQRLQKEEQKRLQEEEAARRKAAEEAQRQETQAEGEARRLAEEAQRMEREARRMRGEPPEPEPEKQTEAGREAEIEAHIAATVIAGAAAAAPASVTAQANRPAAATTSSTASVNTTQTGSGSTTAASTTRSRAPPAAVADPGKPKKERKFCTLPRKVNGRRDETWLPVYMEGMDEVGAHCGLFLAGPHYDGLIGDVGERILGWVQDDLSVRAILEMS
ncbi:hypothetical protein CH63R_04310 [Colletotrichum higginsianum IMI 349063]|uniref:DUF676 domain-containing protein n=2 Tax=Colletotrichum higginsianum TaxID=80884 RepID=A0A1B7YJE8_COLHI|nr:hypothetical protein CH63R_04310 [Colletotrichum higginsianum IMI 349063]OBR12014.1 hypothetical protein CH63R_04310 [Colletotrichum higginsianum IMI 349063]TIC99975.1 Reticulocyte-binding protein 2-like protein a [Colletotrichum higginsianum]